MERPVAHWVGTPSLSSRLAPSRDVGCRREIQLDRQLLRRGPDELEENRFQIEIPCSLLSDQESAIIHSLAEHELGSTRNPMFAQQVAQRAVSDEGPAVP
ncbi:predicted protein [Histoplasma capsulatum var. duboisii H88]|uniref:Predicted protein n=2 Tax=Ajellomyces capsulatus TaxID=5037 RepID=F0UAW7_AJEC8|nr:predicted protein [Histoplasma capsulatum H143]EGC43774.1 predicted protein [Histoplasma capsulatum var. duboisii H88]